MSDKPLFEHMDEQEAEYAPQELPPGSPQARQARIDEEATPESLDEDEAAPGAAAGAAIGGPAGGTWGGQAGVATLPAVDPIMGSEPPTEGEEDEEERST